MRPEVWTTAEGHKWTGDPDIVRGCVDVCCPWFYGCLQSGLLPEAMLISKHCAEMAPGLDSVGALAPFLVCHIVMAWHWRDAHHHRLYL